MLRFEQIFNFILVFNLFQICHLFSLANGTAISQRVKRATGTSLTDMIVSIDIISPMNATTTSVKIGDSFTFELMIDLPAVNATTNLDMNIELFAVSPTTGVGGFCMCNGVQLYNVGPNVVYSGISPGTQYSASTAPVKQSLSIQNINTGGNPDSMTANQFSIGFNSMLCNEPGVTAGAQFYLTAGIQYANETYVWIGQIPMTANPVAMSYDSAAEFADRPVTLISKGDSIEVEIIAHITNPSAPVFLEIYPIESIQDVLHFGDVNVGLGGNFGCSDPSRWSNNPLKSSSGMSNLKQNITYGMLLNSDAYRNVSSSENIVDFHIPVHAMNLPAVRVNLTVDVAFVLMVGDSTMWAGTQSFTIQPPVILPGSPSQCAVNKTLPVKSGGVFAGTGASFLITIVCPSGWNNLNMTLTGIAGVLPVMLDFKDVACLGYVPPWYNVNSISLDNLTLTSSFGTIKNPCNLTTSVTVKASFKTLPTAALGATNVMFTLGTGPPSTLTFNVISNPLANSSNSPQVLVTQRPYPVDPLLVYPGSQVCLDLNVYVPGGVAANELVFEVVPDTLSPTVSTHVCKSIVKNVGSNLPCVKANAKSYLIDQSYQNISIPGNTLNDYSKLTIGGTCPDSESSNSADNTFTVTGCIEVLNYQPNYLPVVNFNVNMGLRQDGSTIWLASSTYTTSPSLMFYNGPPQVTGSCFMDNTFTNGASARSSTQTSSFACQAYCQLYSDCLFFLFLKSSNLCYVISSSSGSLSSNTNYVFGPPWCAENCITDNKFTASGNDTDVGNFPTVFDCQNTCKASNGCQGFRYRKSDGLCSLLAMVINSYNVADTGFMSGPQTCSVLTTPMLAGLDDNMAALYGNPVTFYVNQAFSQDILIKIPPQTFATYNFTIAPNPSFKICKIVVSYVGQNFPCTKNPGSTALPTDNVVLTWSSPTPSTCGVGAQLSFRSLTNWGRGPMTNDLLPDDDSIVVTAFYQVCSGSGQVNISYSLNYGTSVQKGIQALSSSSSVAIVNLAHSLTKLNISQVTMTTDVGGGTFAYIRFPTVMRLNLTIPDGFMNDISINVVNMDFANNKHVDFCDIQVYYVGKNLPCINTNFTVTTLAPSTTIYQSENVHPSMKINVFSICNIPYSADPLNSILGVVVAFRVKSYVPLNTNITMGVQITAGNTVGFNSNYSFIVAALNTTAITPSVIAPNDVKVLIPYNNSFGVNLTVAQQTWITFIVQTPPSTISQSQLSILANSLYGRPQVHLLDVKFDTCPGRNNLCFNQNVDLQRNFATSFNKSTYIPWTFMAKDVITVDLGYIVNAGFTQTMGSNQDSDNQFAVKVLIQMADAMNNNDQTSVYFSIVSNDIVTVGSQLVNCQRPMNTVALRLCCERSNIVIDAKASVPTNVSYNTSSSISYSTLIFHNGNPTSYWGPQSLAEASPEARIRILNPPYLVLNTSSVVSNYSAPQTIATLGTVTDIRLVYGVLFPDVISLNFSMIVDPSVIQPFGKGIANSTIALMPLCKQSGYYNYPLNTSAFSACGGLRTVTMTTNAIDCSDEIPIVNECQVRASSFRDDLSVPFNSLSNVSSWSPAVRDWGAYDYLKFNFNGTARISWFKINSLTTMGTSTYRQAFKVRVEYSNNCDNFNFAFDLAITFDNKVIFPYTLVASNLRIKIISADTNAMDSSPIALNQMKFYGCLPYGDTTPCCKDDSINGTDPTLYRHMSVDTDKNIVYFCDRKGYLKGMYCYFNDRTVPTNLWTKLPHYIASIIGYSKTSGRTYFLGPNSYGYFSTFNGKLIELTSPVDIPADINPALVVPGAARTDMGTISFTGTNYTCNFDGMYDGSTLLTSWSPCCK